ncbi:unnamed protein product [Paramecium sonneborni]|uniref:Uncharacterized protein n=1 Tax=Paramecium sonneborni TaxID=65129 RepID=A0A8S1LQS4_9CILI|nr:unnamed protein product [Paramecium sonneborni]
MKSVIALLNKFNYPKRQIHHFSEIQDGILFAQLEDDFFNCDLKKVLWNQIINSLQRIRRNHNLQIKEFVDKTTIYDCNEELTNFIKYFLETLFYTRKDEFIYFMKQCLDQQQEEIAQFIQSDFQELNSLQDCGQLEYHTTSTIISLEENLYSKDNIITQQTKQIEQMKNDYQTKFIEMHHQIVEQADIIEKMACKVKFFLDKVICNDFEEAWFKFQEFKEDLEKNKQQIEDLNALLKVQEEEISKKRKKNQKLKSQLSSNQPTERAFDYEISEPRDSLETKTNELLKKEILVYKEENLKLLTKQTYYEQEIHKYRKKLYEYEQETTSYKKKMEKYKNELEECLNSNQQEKKNYLDNLRSQGLLSSNNSQILELEQKLWLSPKSNCFEINQSLNKFDQPMNQSFKNSDETNLARLQLQITEKNNKIATLERQINLMQHGSHSRGNSLTKFNQLQQERHVEQSTLLENLRFYIQYSQKKDKEVKEIKEQQNENFLEICKQLIKQNDQIQKLNSLIFEHQNEELMKENTQNINEDDEQNQNQFYLQALNDKDELLKLITSIFYENVKI